MFLKIKFFIGLLVTIIIIMALISFLFFLPAKNNMLFGVSFSPDYTRYLGFKVADVYKTILDDWKFRCIRLSAQWDSIEKSQGEYNFKELDYLMDEAGKRKAQVVLVVGRKTPRWPECHIPSWAQKMEYSEYREPLLDFIRAVAQRYKNHPALEVWQVENEPFLPFGLCKIINQKDLQEEIAAVKRIDGSHPVMVTDSGELSTWLKTARAADLFGTTMYRVVWNKYIGYFSYDWVPAIFYRAKLWVTGRSASTAYVSELQAEPWIPDKTVADTPLSQQHKSMNLQRLMKNTNYASRTGMPRAYLWGAEWWYWMKEKNQKGEYVDFIKTLKKQ